MIDRIILARDGCRSDYTGFCFAAQAVTARTWGPYSELSDATTGIVMADLHLQLLGVPTITLDGVSVTFQRRNTVVLLAYLAVSGTVQPRDSLATLLGGEVTAEQAHKLLSNALTDLRRSLKDYFVFTPHTVAFRRDQPHWLDVAEFAARLAGGLAAPDSGSLQAAVALYRGELLAGWNLRSAPWLDDWLVAQREAYHRQLVQALRALVDRAVQDRALRTDRTAA